MRSFFFALKIAAVFAIVMVISLAATLKLFGRVAGHGVLSELGLLRAHEGLVLAEDIESRLDDHTPSDAMIAAVAEHAAEARGTEARLETDPERLADPNPSWHGHRRPERTVTVRGRRCRIIGPPNFETWIPVHSGGATVAYLVIGGPLHPPKEHHDFFIGLLRIGAITLLGVIGLALYLSSPLRRMSRSMNRIAAGDLDHRAPVKGHDEIAEVGRSFNAMADRISSIIGGQKELLAAVSHELRSPLARMKMNLELLRGGTDPDRRIVELESEIATLDGMVDELLIASRLDLLTDRLDVHDVDLEACAHEAWTRAADDAAERGMDLAIDFGPHASHVTADRNLVVRTLANLFENAVRYAGSGTVSMTSRTSNGRIIIDVSDRGPGVPDEALDRLFEPFYRADASRSRRTGATGLGLMIVRRAVEAHGGSTRALRNPQGGLTVSFDLPAAHT